ncbi:hypothetical protein EMCG_00510 [[Emmonsia] crescens]|uniref:Uncharacterized protein n=1 Tax=[Emmonsia] crescens TaxID=73230 RepID=A0A0G2HUM5_9EURO|nr:hypothetical protein EMCG_00510 [Emmonsia crescens UAMH 3008]
MGTLHPRSRYMTGHLPSPRMLNSEISIYHSPQMDLKEAVYALAAAVLYARHSQYVESLEEHTGILRRGSSLISRAPVWFNIGSLWALVGDFRRAMDAYELSINEDREFTISWFCKGICHFLLREYCESKNTFRKCSSTFKMFSQVKFFDDYSLDFVLVKDDVVWNTNVAKRRYKMQGALSGVDALEPKLRRDYLNLFLGPHKDCFKLDEMFSKKRGSGPLSLIPRPSIIRKNSCCQQRKYAYVGFPEMQEGGTKVVLGIPASRGQSTASSKPQRPQPTANATGLSRFPSVILRKRVPAPSSISSRREQSSSEWAAIVNAFPLPPPTLRRRGYTPGHSLMTEQAGTRRNSEGQISSLQVQREQTPAISDGAFPSPLVPTPRSATDTFSRTRLSGVDQLSLPSFIFPSSPQPGPSQMQQGRPPFSNSSADNASIDNNLDVNNNITAAQSCTPNPYSHQSYYRGFPASSISVDTSDGDYDSHTIQQSNDVNEARLSTVGFGRTPEEHNRNDPQTHITTASVETSMSHETFYSAPEGLNNRVSEAEPSTSSSTACSNSPTELSLQNFSNSRLRRRIFERMLVFLPITESGGIARSRRRCAGASTAAVNERPQESGDEAEHQDETERTEL